MKQDKQILVPRAWLEGLVELKRRTDETVILEQIKWIPGFSDNLFALIGYIDSARELLNK